MKVLTLLGFSSVEAFSGFDEKDFGRLFEESKAKVRSWIERDWSDF